MWTRLSAAAVVFAGLIGFLANAAAFTEWVSNKLASQAEQQIVPQPTTATEIPAVPPLFRITLADGQVLQANPIVQFQVIDAIVAFQKLGENGRIESAVGYALQRQLLRQSSKFNKKEFLLLRSEIEKDVTGLLEAEFRPQGVTVSDVSIGQIW